MASKMQVIPGQTPSLEDYGLIAIKIERLIIFALVLFPNYSSSCLSFLVFSNLFYIIARDSINSSVYQEWTFWLERFAMILVALQKYVFPQCNFWYVAAAYFGFANMIYMAQLKKNLPRKVLLPGSPSSGVPNPTEGRGYFFWFGVEACLALLSFAAVVVPVIGSLLRASLVSFAIPAVVVYYLEPEKYLLHKNLTYNTPEPISTRILDSKDPKDLFFFERVATLLLLIDYGARETASSWHLPACLFAVTNTIYFANHITLILDNFIDLEATGLIDGLLILFKLISDLDAENAKTEEEDDQSASEESSTEDQDAIEASEEASEAQEAIKTEAKSRSPSKEASEKDQSCTSSKQGTINEHQQKTVLPLIQNLFQFQQQPRQMQMQSPNAMTLDPYHNTLQTLLNEANKELQNLREEKAKWDSEKKNLTSKLEENKELVTKLTEEEIKGKRLAAKLKEKRQRIIKLEKELEEAVKHLKSEVDKLRPASEHYQAVLAALEERGREWTEEKNRLVRELGELKEDRKVDKLEKARLEEKLETAEGRYEYYLGVVECFARKSEECDEERERLTTELREVADRCELYKSLLRGGEYGTPNFRVA